MTGTELLGVVAGAFGVGMGASPLLQAVKAHRRRSSADVSVSFLFVLLLGGLAWLAYGVALGNTPLIVGNTVGVCVEHGDRGRRSLAAAQEAPPGLTVRSHP